MNKQEKDKQEKEVKKQYDLYIKKLTERTRFAGTALAETNCELCESKINFIAFTTFMYPDYSLKTLCNSCGVKERLRLDYSNKN